MSLVLWPGLPSVRVDEGVAASNTVVGEAGVVADWTSVWILRTTSLNQNETVLNFCFKMDFKRKTAESNQSLLHFVTTKTADSLPVLPEIGHKFPFFSPLFSCV